MEMTANELTQLESNVRKLERKLDSYLTGKGANDRICCMHAFDIICLIINSHKCDEITEEK